MNSSVILSRAAASMSGAAAYSTKGGQPVYLAKMRGYSATEALERANCRLRSGTAYCARGDAADLAEAKSRVCRVVGFPHIDLWEWVAKPDWLDVKRVFLEAAA